MLGPGLLAGLSDDDPAGITTYSVLGAEHGYQLLWVLLLSTVALMLFHDLGARMGVVTGQGLIGLVRHRYGVRMATATLAALVVANVGTAAAEFAGIAAGGELLGVDRSVSVPVAAVAVTVLVLAGSFHRVEHVLLALASVFVAYVAAGILAHPDWAAAGRGLVVPTLGLSAPETLLVAATVGTTLAPWGLSFIQSYAVDKRLTTADLRYERVDVLVVRGLTGVIGFFVVVACAATRTYLRSAVVSRLSTPARAARPAPGLHPDPERGPARAAAGGHAPALPGPGHHGGVRGPPRGRPGAAGGAGDGRGQRGTGAGPGSVRPSEAE